MTERLKSLYSLCTVKISWEGAFGSAYRIDVSSDGTTWTAAAIDGATDAGVRETHLPDGTQGRYVRFDGTSRGTVWGYSFWTMSIYKKAPSPPSAPPPESAYSNGYSIIIPRSASEPGAWWQKADFRGIDRAIFSFVSSREFGFLNIKTENADFL